MYKLSSFIWPRNANNQQNNSLLSYSGARVGLITKHIVLPKPKEVTKSVTDSVVACDDKSLRVSHDGVLSAIDINGNIQWSTNIDFEGWHSSITSLEDNKTLLYTKDTVLVYDCNGKVEFKKTFDTVFENNGIAPNITYDGHIVIGSNDGEVFLISEDSFKIISTEGYDICMPAIHDDNSIVIADYYGLGACCFNTSGDKIYSNNTCAQVDLLPVINKKGITAVGSRNNQCSYFLDKSGNIVHKLDVAAEYTQYIDGGWIELSPNRLRRISSTYDEMWSLKISGLCLPIVDKNGLIYINTKHKLLCIDGKGKIKYKLNSEGKPSSISVVAKGEMCFIANGVLHIYE